MYFPSYEETQSNTTTANPFTAEGFTLTARGGTVPEGWYMLRTRGAIAKLYLLRKHASGCWGGMRVLPTLGIKYTLSSPWFKTSNVWEPISDYTGAGVLRKIPGVTFPDVGELGARKTGPVPAGLVMCGKAGPYLWDGSVVLLNLANHEFTMIQSEDTITSATPVKVEITLC